MFDVLKRHKFDLNRLIWETWKIQSYRVRVRFNWEFLNFDRDIISDTTTVVVDKPYARITEEYTSSSYIHDNDLWTVDGLFEQLAFYPDVEYDKVYGYPKRLGHAGHWIIEVISFETLSFVEDDLHYIQRIEDIRDNLRWFYIRVYRDIRWHYLSIKYYLLGKRQTIKLKDFLMTGSFGGIQLGITEDEVVDILGDSSAKSGNSIVIGTLEVGFEVGKVKWVKHNCNKFDDKPYPPTIHLQGFAPEYDDTTIDEFIGYLESENIPYEVTWEEVMNVRFPKVHINGATEANFAEDTLAIMGIYPKGK